MMRLPRTLDKDQFSQLSGLAILDFEINFHAPNWIKRAEFLTSSPGAPPIEGVHFVVVCTAFNAVPPTKKAFRAASSQLLI
jgi:hypothetical protein